MYAGREIHIHLKVYPAGTESTSEGTHVCHTGQIFLPDETNVAVSQVEPYVSSKTTRTTKFYDHVFSYRAGSVPGDDGG